MFDIVYFGMQFLFPTSSLNGHYLFSISFDMIAQNLPISEIVWRKCLFFDVMRAT